MADEPKVQDSTADSSTATVEKPEVPEDDFALPEDVKDEKSRSRFQKLVDRAKAAEASVAGYKEYGTPEQIDEYVQYNHGLETKLEQTSARLRQLEAGREPGEPKTDEEKALEAHRKTVRQQLRENEPLLDRMEKFLAAHDEEKKARIESLTMDAVEATETVMKKHGLPTTRGEIQDMCDLLEPIIKKHPRLRFRFERNPAEAIDQAMSIYLDKAKVAIEGRTRLESQRTKERTSALPRAHGGGGGPGATKPSEPAKNISEGMARGMSRWRERGT